LSVIRPNGQLFSTRPDERLTAARAANKRARKALAERVKDWPSSSPGSLNAWLLLVTTKEPVWRDPYITWEELPLTLGTAHQGFFYPDPMGFFAEIRRWAVELFRLVAPRWTAPDALALTTLVHASRGKEHLTDAIEMFQPRVILFLDEPSWHASGLVVDEIAHYIRDPHRPKQVYEGFWGVTETGMVVGKSPQHPTTHNLYRAEDLNGYLRSAPLRPEPRPT
jgi:hypothetical protein